MSLDFRTLWNEALPFAEYVAASTEHKGLWDGLYRIATPPEWAAALDLTATPRKLLVLAEDWCGDASNTIPHLARFVDQARGLELRILRRDEYPAVMDRYLTGTARAIPIVIGLDAQFRELGHWGPRPTELQAWVMANKESIPKDERYPLIRKWYARDRGHSTIREVLAAALIPVPAPAPAGSPA